MKISSGHAILNYITRLWRRIFESAAANQRLAKPVSVRVEALPNSELQCHVFALCARVLFNLILARSSPPTLLSLS